MTQYPPFNYEGSNKLPEDCSFDGNATMTGTYTIQVETKQKADSKSYVIQKNYCSSLNEYGKSDWRVPTQIELHAMYMNKDKIESSTDAKPFIGNDYWSTSVYDGKSGARCLLNLATGNFYGTNDMTSNRYVRCVRDE